MKFFLKLFSAALSALLLAATAQAAGLAEISNKDAAAGLKQALIKGSQAGG